MGSRKAGQVSTCRAETRAVTLGCVPTLEGHACCCSGRTRGGHTVWAGGLVQIVQRARLKVGEDRGERQPLPPLPAVPEVPEELRIALANNLLELSRHLGVKSLADAVRILSGSINRMFTIAAECSCSEVLLGTSR